MPKIKSRAGFKRGDSKMTTYVTRTLSVTKVTAQVARLNADFSVSVEEKTVTLDGIKTAEAAQKELEKGSQGVRVRVTDVQTINKVWGISLEDFIKYGHEVKRPESQLAACMKQ